MHRIIIEVIKKQDYVLTVLCQECGVSKEKIKSKYFQELGKHFEGVNMLTKDKKLLDKCYNHLSETLLRYIQRGKALQDHIKTTENTD